MPAAALLMGLALGGCEPEPVVMAKYGVAFVDEDGDGYETGRDCNDLDPEIHPGAEEKIGDGIDSNCDGKDDT